MNIDHPDKTALIYEDKKISYQKLIEKISSFSSYIDPVKNQKAAIFCENSPQWIYALFAIWQKDAVAVPVDALSDVGELSYILNDSKPALLFVSKNCLKTAKKALENINHPLKLIVTEDIKDQYISTSRKLFDFGKERDALILYTSGTTGLPKGVVLSFKNLYSNINSIEKTKVISPSDSVLALLPFHHSYPLMTTILSPLYFGCTICIVRELSSEVIIKNLQKHKLTIFVGVPRLFDLFHGRIMEGIEANIFLKILFNIARFINSKPLSSFVFKRLHKRFGGNLRYFVSGGAKLDKIVVEDFRGLGFDIIEGYGLTETSPIISFNPPEKIRAGSCGKVIENVFIKLVEGEIAVRGDNVTKGYYNLPEKTAEAIKEEWFYTGDLGRIDDEGYLYITGRKKDMIVLPSGKNINPEEIENALLKTSPYIKEAGVLLKDGSLFAIIYPDFEYLKEKLNITEALKWGAIDAYNLKAASHKKITGFKVVNNELPKTRLGKIKHFRLKEILTEEEKQVSCDEPKSEIYSLLKEYLKKISKKEVRPDDNIEIDLGLDSLAKIEMLSFIDATFGIDIDEVTLSGNLSVQKLYNLIEKGNKKIYKDNTHWEKILLENGDEKPDLSRNSFVLKFVSGVLKIVSRLYFSLEIKQNHPLPNKPFIIAPNHQSLLDGPLIMASLPNEILKDTYFLMDETFFKNEGLRRYVDNKTLHIIAVNKDLNLKSSMQKSAAVLKQGKNIVIFPEGARSRDGELMEFKKFFAILAKELDVPVVPVSIMGAFEAFPVKSSFPRPGKITIEFLEPVKPKGSVEEIVSRTKDSIARKPGE